MFIVAIELFGQKIEYLLWSLEDNCSADMPVAVAA